MIAGLKASTPTVYASGGPPEGGHYRCSTPTETKDQRPDRLSTSDCGLATIDYSRHGKDGAEFVLGSRGVGDADAEYAET